VNSTTKMGTMRAGCLINTVNPDKSRWFRDGAGLPAIFMA
jgi:hypothetical protein